MNNLSNIVDTAGIIILCIPSITDLNCSWHLYHSYQKQFDLLSHKLSTIPVQADSVCTLYCLKWHCYLPHYKNGENRLRQTLDLANAVSALFLCKNFVYNDIRQHVHHAPFLAAASCKSQELTLMMIQVVSDSK